MGVKGLFFFIIGILLISSCATNKTKPIVSDVGGDFKEEAVVGVKPIEENKTVLEKVEETEINETVEEEQEEELPPGTHIITIKDLKLDPQDLTIKRGDTVIWKHEDTYEDDKETRHYLAAHNKEFRSPILFYGQTFEHTFNNTGTFTYIDVLYKDKSYMGGKIVVE